MPVIHEREDNSLYIISKFKNQHCTWQLTPDGEEILRSFGFATDRKEISVSTLRWLKRIKVIYTNNSGLSGSIDERNPDTSELRSLPYSEQLLLKAIRMHGNKARGNATIAAGATNPGPVNNKHRLIRLIKHSEIAGEPKDVKTSVRVLDRSQASVFVRKEPNSQKLSRPEKANFLVIDEKYAQCLLCKQGMSKIRLNRLEKHMQKVHKTQPLQQNKKQSDQESYSSKEANCCLLDVEFARCLLCDADLNASVKLVDLEEHMATCHGTTPNLRERAKDDVVDAEVIEKIQYISPKKVCAAHKIALGLAQGDQNLIEHARIAVESEYRCSTTLKQLRCLHVIHQNEIAENVYKLEIGHSIDLDWSWEGAMAFRPRRVACNENDLKNLDELERRCSSEEYMWAGEVLEIDNAGGSIYLSVIDKRRKPTKGFFYIKPFEFLHYLNKIYDKNVNLSLQNHLCSRLRATLGSVIPQAVSRSGRCVEKLKNMWNYAWGILWGPPGTGKTTMIGKQVAQTFLEPDERVLVISTTNKATDEIALKIAAYIGEAQPKHLEDGRILRIGKGADYNRFRKERSLGLLRGTETELLRQIAGLRDQLSRATDSIQRASIQVRMKDVEKAMKNRAFEHFMSEDVKIVVATAFKAMEMLDEKGITTLLATGHAPFSTVIVDEAGLISRAAGAALSLLAGRRVVFAGDPKQLAPISLASRVLAVEKAEWLASSCLSHLQTTRGLSRGVVLLDTQYRMHPHISKVISEFQYDGSLKNAPSTENRFVVLPELVREQPRAVWNVLDDEDEFHKIRSSRGEGNRSWVRPITRSVLDKFFHKNQFERFSGIFVTPFKAQADDISRYFKEKSIVKWSAATIHSYQGTEADVVIMDTVNASSYGWNFSEWKRLVNVGLSRGRHFVMLLASRAEMSQPFLQPLAGLLTPKFLRNRGGNSSFIDVVGDIGNDEMPPVQENDNSLGAQLQRIKALRPILSKEQEWLCARELDGKPRLVRGVAGSGKTYVLAIWLVKTLLKFAKQPQKRIKVVFGNASLQPMLRQLFVKAWSDIVPDRPIPERQVDFIHIKSLLVNLGKKSRLNLNFGDGYDYDLASADYLYHTHVADIESVCDAMFLDEAQDMGPNTLKLLALLVKAYGGNKDRAIYIFYDNAQNLYDRKMPSWKELGIDIKGRSTIMEESFRSTRPIAEFAVNCLYAQKNPDSDPDYKEMLARGLIESSQKEGKPWWRIHFNQISGPAPIFNECKNIDEEIQKIGDRIIKLVEQENVTPGDIVVLAMDHTLKNLDTMLGSRLRDVGISLTMLKGAALERSSRSVLLTTPHAFKGYDAEIILVAGVEDYYGKGEIRMPALYVAMTRARSILELYGVTSHRSIVKDLYDVIRRAASLAGHHEPESCKAAEVDLLHAVLEKIGRKSKEWFEKILAKHDVSIEPILSDDGAVLVEPLFKIEEGDPVIVCFEDETQKKIARLKLANSKYELISVGAALPEVKMNKRVITPSAIEKSEKKPTSQESLKAKRRYIVNDDTIGLCIVIDSHTGKEMKRFFGSPDIAEKAAALAKELNEDKS